MAHFIGKCIEELWGRNSPLIFAHEIFSNIYLPFPRRHTSLLRQTPWVITDLLPSVTLDIVPSPLSLRLFLDSEVTPHFPTVASSLLHRRDTVPPLTKISNKDLPIILHMPLHTPAYPGIYHIPVFDPGFRIP